MLFRSPLLSWDHLARYRDLKLVSCLQVNIPRGYGYVEFKTRVDAEKAQLFMDGVGFFLFGGGWVCKTIK